MSGGILSGGYCPGGYCQGGYCPDTGLHTDRKCRNRQLLVLQCVCVFRLVRKIDHSTIEFSKSSEYRRSRTQGAILKGPLYINSTDIARIQKLNVDNAFVTVQNPFITYRRTTPYTFSISIHVHTIGL